MSRNFILCIFLLPYICLIEPLMATEVDEKCSRGNSGCERPKIICYFTNWSTNRTGISQYHVSDIDSSLCTHIIYSFAILNPKTLTMEFSSQKTDEEDKLYQQVTDLKSKGLKVSIALGGWLDSGDGEKYSKMINNGNSRSNFVHQTVLFLRKFNFDGVDLDWEFPKCWHGNCTVGPNSDKNNFGNLVKELRKAFLFNNFLLSVAVSADRTISTEAYNINAFSQHLDWIGIMAYDYNLGSYEKTSHHSPYMGPHPNTVDAIQFWLDLGVPPQKLVMGIPFYGRSFTLLDPNIHGIGAPATIGNPSLYTSENGFISFFEFCNGSEWIHRTVPGVGSYTFKKDQWVSYNDVNIIQQKAEFIKQYKLGGAMIWALDLDDFSGQFCNQGKYPLLNALNNAL